MSMETTAWTQLHSVMNAQQDRRPFARATLRRIARVRPPAPAPHRPRSSLLSVVTALLAVATPVLAGRVVDAIVSGGDDRARSSGSPLLIALIAVCRGGARAARPAGCRRRSARG